MSPRSLRNGLQRRCDQVFNCVENTKHHVYEMHKVYYTGEEFPKMEEWVDIETQEYLQAPKYPEHIVHLDELIALLDTVQKYIKVFKDEMV